MAAVAFVIDTDVFDGFYDDCRFRYKLVAITREPAVYALQAPGASIHDMTLLHLRRV